MSKRDDLIAAHRFIEFVFVRSAPAELDARGVGAMESAMRGFELIDAAIVRASMEMRREPAGARFREMARRAWPAPNSMLAVAQVPQKKRGLSA